jgi:hypothetical protein
MPKYDTELLHLERTENMYEYYAQNLAINCTPKDTLQSHIPHFCLHEILQNHIKGQ